MRIHYRGLKQLFESKLGQELPGWAFIVGLILALFALIFLIWFAVKAGKTGVEELPGLG